jgi:hypothetical protein
MKYKHFTFPAISRDLAWERLALAPVENHKQESSMGGHSLWIV